MVIENVRYYKPASIYPGIYQPLQGKDDELLIGKGVKTFRPPVNVIEMTDFYQIEMPAPGLKKEDFVIRTEDCSVSIIGKLSHPGFLTDGLYHDRGFYHEYLHRNVVLPADADTDFGTAEYKNGVLCIYFYKSSCPVKNLHGNIIVY